MLVEARTPSQVREHYLIERELAERLRGAPKAARPALYREVYDELYCRVPHHPQLLALRDPRTAARRARSVEHQLAFLRRFLPPGKRFLEIGAGDCALALRAAPLAARVYAVDVSRQITRGVKPPANFELRLTEGSRMPLEDGAADVAFSNQLMEHLHPEDAAEQLREIRRSLAPGGLYVCITPNRLGGPSDVSGHFDEVATGLHLREYSARELHALMLESGFSAVRFYAGARGWYLRVPFAALAALEALLEAAPHRLRRRIARLAPARALLGLRAVALA
jgi:SAM-dependent methyltransferase